MKRFVIITVGKTHSGKTTFAKALEKELPHSFVMDQDNQAEFINTHYEKLQPAEGLIHLSTVFRNSLLIMQKNIQIYTLLLVTPIAVKRKVIFTKRIISTK